MTIKFKVWPGVKLIFSVGFKVCWRSNMSDFEGKGLTSQDFLVHSTMRENRYSARSYIVFTSALKKQLKMLGNAIPRD